MVTVSQPSPVEPGEVRGGGGIGAPSLWVEVLSGAGSVQKDARVLLGWGGQLWTWVALGGELLLTTAALGEAPVVGASSQLFPKHLYAAKIIRDLLS